MQMPGFTAELSLAPQVGIYRGKASYGSPGTWGIVAPQVDSWTWGADVPEWWPFSKEPSPPMEGEPFDPIGTWPTEPPIFLRPPMPPPPPIAPGPGFLPIGLGGWLTAAGLALIIAASAYRLYRWWHTPPPEMGPSGPACKGTGRELAKRETWDWSFAGCEASLQNALNAAQKECDKLASIECIGNCADPTKRCHPVAAPDIIDDHKRGVYCWTGMTFTCPCECV
jgi:hypothetical protein